MINSYQRKRVMTTLSPVVIPCRPAVCWLADGREETLRAPFDEKLSICCYMRFAHAEKTGRSCFLGPGEGPRSLLSYESFSWSDAFEVLAIRYRGERPLAHKTRGGPIGTEPQEL